MRSGPWMYLVSAVILSSLVVAQEAEEAITSWDFESELENWIVLDPQAKIGLTHDADAVFKGQGTLEFTYMQRLPVEGEKDDIPGMMVVSLPANALGLKTIRFAVSTAYSTPILIGLNEEDGSNYQTVVWSEAGKWNECEVSLREFTQGDDSIDENGKLDPEQVNLLAFADAGLFARTLEKAGMPIYNAPPAESTIWLDEIVFSSREAEKPDLGGEDEYLLDPCSSETVHWLALGAEDLILGTQTPDDGSEPFLRARYIAPPDKIFGLARNVPPGFLDGARGISFEIRTEMPASLVLATEQRDGERFAAMRQVDTRGKWDTVRVEFAEMNREGGGQQAVSIKPGDIKTLIIADLLPITGGSISANTWDLRNLGGYQ